MATTKRRGRIQRDDTLVSGAILTRAVNDIRRRTRLDRAHDVPYLAGYSVDGRTIYIDRHLPRSFAYLGRRVYVDPYLILHESVEKTLLTELGLHYQHAHQIALRAEEAAVRAAGIPWRQYDRFMRDYIKEAGDEKLRRLPLDLDVKPYRDEHDTQLLKRMLVKMKAQRRKQP